MSRITLGNVTIDRDRFEVWVGSRRVDLTFVEFELLCYLARNAGKVLSRPKLMLAIWNEPSHGQDRKLTVHMSRLRKKMRGTSPWHIETITKRGYALVGGTTPSPPANGRHPREAPLAIAREAKPMEA
jgi:two-component system, OmpR family, alkaline phosphatase synthesis response regulator PhoP